MSTLNENIQQAINDFDDIKEAIIEKGVAIPNKTPTSQYADKVRQIEGGANLNDFILGLIPEIETDIEIVPDFAFSAKNNLSTVHLPEATYIGKFAFSSAPTMSSVSGSGDGDSSGDEPIGFTNHNLVTVDMPKVTTIKECAFKRDVNLEISELPDSLSVIESSAFYCCDKVKLRKLPSSLRIIESEALYHSDGSNSVSITSFPPDLETIQDDNGIDMTNVDWSTLPSNIRTLSSDGNSIDREQMKSYLNQYTSENPWGPSSPRVLHIDQLPPQWFQVYMFDSNLTSLCRNYWVYGDVSIPEDVTSIARDKFSSSQISGVDNYPLILTIPNTVTSIGDYAFSGCSNLLTVTLPTNITAIPHGVFSQCNNLANVDIPDSCEYVISYAFYGCYGLKSLSLPQGLKVLESEAFAYVGANVSSEEGTTYLELPGTIERMDSGCFRYSLPHLQRMDIRMTEHTIDRDTFKGIGTTYKNLTVVIYGENVQSINYESFANSGLSRIFIPTSVTSMNGSAFNNLCSDSLDIYYEGTETDWSRHFGNNHYGANMHYEASPSDLDD